MFTNALFAADRIPQPSNETGTLRVGRDLHVGVGWACWSAPRNRCECVRVYMPGGRVILSPAYIASLVFTTLHAWAAGVEMAEMVALVWAVGLSEVLYSL